jgi:hypothetical protein
MFEARARRGRIVNVTNCVSSSIVPSVRPWSILPARTAADMTLKRNLSMMYETDLVG